MAKVHVRMVAEVAEVQKTGGTLTKPQRRRERKSQEVAKAAKTQLQKFVKKLIPKYTSKEVKKKDLVRKTVKKIRQGRRSEKRTRKSRNQKNANCARHQEAQCTEDVMRRRRRKTLTKKVRRRADIRRESQKTLRGPQVKHRRRRSITVYPRGPVPLKTTELRWLGEE